jgi:hypothetical protein
MSLKIVGKKAMIFLPLLKYSLWRFIELGGIGNAGLLREMNCLK